MIDVTKILAVARTEARLTRRLTRYWLFLALAFGGGLLLFFYYSAIHAFGSAFSPTIGMINPRYLVSAIGSVYLTGFTIGVIFLAFDVRARDVRESMVEVLDARPLTNLELIAGRFIGLLLCAWIPVILLALLLQTLGWLLPLVGSPLGRAIEPISLIGFALPMTLPALAFNFALVFTITLLVRHRLIAALLSVALLAGMYWATITWPAIHAPYVDFLGMTMMDFPSDIVPSMLRPEGWLQRAGYLAFALGLVGIAAVIHPRLDGGRRGLTAGISAGLMIIGLASLAGASGMRGNALARAERWTAAHTARVADPFPDLQTLSGSVGIEPGKNLTVKLQIRLQAPAEMGLDKLLFTLNPGFTVDSASAGDGAALSITHADGLLDIQLPQPLPAGESLDLALEYHGSPVVFFAYLDSSLKMENLKTSDAQVGLLGFEPGVFDRRYVALMPGIHWLPSAGAAVGRDDTRKRRRDFFTIDLEVGVPSDWIVAGPGKRTPIDKSADQARFRFAPRVDLPEVALLASEFKSYATEIDGINFEVLVHPDHDQNLALLGESRDEVERWVADRLEINRTAGLDYPFDAFTLVEVPSRLRSFQGGWRLNTALAPPGLMLLRESGFPTARFDFDIGNSFGNKRDFDQEGGKARIDRDRLIGFFNNDVSGGNLFTGAAQSIYAHRTSAYGPDAIALDYTLEELATLILSGQRSYFSAHLFTSINQTATSVINSIQGRGASSVADALITAFTTQTKVWDAALQTPLSDLDPYADPQKTIDVLTLKAGKLAQAIYDSLGPETTGRMLAQLLKERAGQSFTRADLVTAAAGAGGDLGALFDDWFGTADLPGFIADNVEFYRLPDTESGESAYQLLVRVRNDEPVTGFARVAWTMTAEDQQDYANRTRSEPFRVDGRSAVRFGTVLSKPPVAVYVEPYLALNREDFLAQTLATEDIQERQVEPVNGVMPTPWDQGSDDRIIVDDLDPGFSAVMGAKVSGMRLLGQGIDAGEDQGLPVATGQGIPAEWRRRAGRNTFGRYRHTLAYIRPGKGDNRVIMKAQIPAAGNWELEFHMPLIPYIPPDRRGIWPLTIVTAEGREEVNFNANGSINGWILVGEYYLPAGEVSVELTDKTDGTLVVADAIAWSPANGNNTDDAKQDEQEIAQ